MQIARSLLVSGAWVVCGCFVALSVLSGAAIAQHDGQRDSVILIGKGKHDQISKKLAKKKPNSGKAESLFVEMLSFLDQDQLELALAKAKASFEAGLPIERFEAGPRELLSKLHALQEYQAFARSKKPEMLIHGPMLGAATDKSVSVWFRTRRPATVKAVVKLSKNKDPVQGATSTSVTTSSKSDFTGVVQIRGLQPHTVYDYQLLIDGKPSRGGTFRTRPAIGQAGEFRIAFGGGAGFVPEWEYMWDTIRGFKPDAFLTLGDNVYIDDPQHSLTNHYCYQRRQSRPEWRRLTAGTPIYSIYDDHDFGTNDCIPGPEIETPKWKRRVWDIFRQNWANPAYGGGVKQPGCWYDFHVGDVHFIMLDGRYYRDLKGGSMLGPVQKKWLFQTLAESNATFKIIASPVPFTAKIKPGSRDPWDGYPAEREEIFDFLQSKKIEGVFLIAADRHRTDLRITKRAGGYDLYEFESSRLTNHHTHGVVKTEGLVWGYNKTCSFGLMRFNTRKSDPEVIFEAIDIDGKRHYQHVLKRSQLSFVD